MLCYDEEKDAFLPLPMEEGETVLSLAVDADDNVYLSTNNGLMLYNASLTRFSFIHKTQTIDFTTGVDGIIPLFSDSKGNLWVGRNGKGVMCFPASGDKPVIWDETQISDGTVRAITEDLQGRIWLGTEKGITVMDDNGHIDIIRSVLNEPSSISDNAIYTILCDNEGNVWIGSYFGGVDILSAGDHPFRWSEPASDTGHLQSRIVRMMTEVEPGIIWIATEDNGIQIYNTSTDTFTSFTSIPEIGTNVHSLYYDDEKHEMWIGTFRQGLICYNLLTHSYKRYLTERGLKSDAIFYLLPGKDKSLWVASTQGLRRYDAKADLFVPTSDERLNQTFVYTLCSDSMGNIWAGTTQDGLFRIDAATGNVTRHYGTGRDMLSANDYISCLLSDKAGNIWVGTDNKGAFLINQEGLITNLTHYMPSEPGNICSISEDTEGILWIATSNGLLRCQPDSMLFTRFSTSNGLPTNQFNYSSALLTSDGQLRLGTVNGLISFSPEAVHPQGQRCVIHLGRLSIDNQLVTASEKGSPLEKELDECSELTLTHGQAHSFAIEYGVVRPGITNNIEYRIRLDGIDNTWRYCAGERVFRAYNLPHGTYTLHIQANDMGLSWEENPIRSLRIVVLPPIWQSPWAYVLYLLLLIALLFFLFLLLRRREKNLSRKNKERLEKEKQEEISRTKLDFFAAVSHELKTPLSLIEAPLKCIAEEQLSKDSRKHLSTAIHNTHKLEALIGELVTFNKLETGDFPFYIQKGNPLAFVEQTTLLWSDVAREKQITLELQSEDNGEEVWFSPSYLDHILSNLLSNAFKFTPSGGQISVKACITTLPSTPHSHLLVTVSDTGIGIAKEEQTNIFNLYYQTKRGYNANHSGWGIGLSLVGRLVDIHQGRIQVESEPGKGATFTFLLNVSAEAFDKSCMTEDKKTLTPLNEYQFSSHITEETGSSANECPPTPLIPNPRLKETCNLLIVDDNADMLSFLSDFFTPHYRVYTATNGEQAIAMAHSLPIQMIISDVMMPGMSGNDLCHTLKSDMTTSHIPIILLTARTEQDDVIEGYRSGAEAYVGKPFDPQILQLQVGNILQLQKTRQSEIARQASSDAATDSLTELDRQFIQKMDQLVMRNIDNPDFAISDITEGIGISRSLLHIKMKNLVGISMGDYIRRKRLDLACHLLEEGHNVSETAYRTGFSDPNYFSKTFRKHMGVSPSDFIHHKNEKKNNRQHASEVQDTESEEPHLGAV